MFSYRNEAAFSKALLRSWENNGYKIQRIESPTTSRGIPDLFVETPDYSYWIELKRIHFTFHSESDPLIINWGPNQQSWMLEKYIASKYRRPCFTFVAYNDCVISIPMTKRFIHNKVYRKDISHVWYSLSSIVL